MLIAAWLTCGASGCDDPVAKSDSESRGAEGDDPVASALVNPIRVRVAPAATTDLPLQATAAGVVEAFRTVTVAAETTGRVTRRSVEPGDAVTGGQVLVRLDDERARIARDQAEAAVRSREIDLRKAASELQRGRNLDTRSFISQDILEDLGFAEARARAALEASRAALAAAERVLADTEVRAPFDGEAERIHVHEGDYVIPGASVATLADFAKARIKAGITAREAALLQGAGHAGVTLDALGSNPVRGRIKSVARVADAATGTYALEMWLEDMGERVHGRLREGMLARVHLPSPGSTARLAVPSSAVFRRDGIMHAFVVRDGRATLRPVRTGRTNGAATAVLEGLSEGDLVVTDGQFALRDGARVVVEH